MKLQERKSGNPDFRHFLGEATVHRNLRWVMACRSRASSQSLYILLMSIFLSAYYLTLFFQVIVFPFLEPLAVDFDLPSGPSHSPKPNTTKHTTKIIILAPRIFWTHGSAAASAKRTEIRRAVSTPWNASRRFRSRPLLSQAQAVACKYVT